MITWEVLFSVELWICKLAGFLQLCCLCVCVCVCSEAEEEMEFQEFKRSYLKGMNDDEDEDGNVSGGDDMAPKEK